MSMNILSSKKLKRAPASDTEDEEGVSVRKGRGRPTIVHNVYEYDAQLALAFQIDCHEILDEFKSGTDLSFGRFAKLWRDKAFIRIFDGEEIFGMLQTFIDNCYLIIKKFFNEPDLATQICAIYLLYGVYYKQPVTGWVKIRLTMTEALKIDEILQKSESKEALYIYCKLKVDEAFDYVALSQPLGPHKHCLRRIDLDKVKLEQDSKTSGLSQFRNILKDPVMEKYREIDKEYQLLLKKCTKKYPELVTGPSVDICAEINKTHHAIFGGNETETIKTEFLEAK